MLEDVPFTGALSRIVHDTRGGTSWGSSDRQRSQEKMSAGASVIESAPMVWIGFGCDIWKGQLKEE